MQQTPSQQDIIEWFWSEWLDDAERARFIHLLYMMKLLPKADRPVEVIQRHASRTTIKGGLNI